MSEPDRQLVSVPVILCGRRVEIGQPVSEMLTPEFEVVHFITTNEAALTDIPRLLKGEKPQVPDDSGVGSQNYSQVPRAVILGGGYSLADLDNFMDACQKYDANPVVWIVADPKRKPGVPGPQYARDAAMEVKRKLEGYFGAAERECSGVLYW